MTAGDPVVAVVGAGIAGLAAALEVRRLLPAARVVLFESSAQVGGKLRSSEVAGVVVDEAADSLVRRVPDGLALVEEVGLTGDLVTPATAAAGVWAAGALHPLPARTLLGIPADLRALRGSGVLSPAALARCGIDLVRPGESSTDDVSVGALVRRRLGAQVVSRLVDPLLGGVYAGQADQLSLQATVPALAAHLPFRRGLVRAARAALVPPAPGGAFAGLPGGLSRLAVAAAAAGGADVRLRTTVRGLARTAGGWQLETGSAAAPVREPADAVVLAVPAAAAARLLAPHAPAAAGELAGIDYASVALVTLAFDGATPGTGSGYLVSADSDRLVKAVTFSSRKWAHLGGGPAIVRTSLGRYGESAALQREDHELVAAAVRELAASVGPPGRLLDSRVTRWGGALPQYTVGHVERVARIRREVARLPGVAVAGAAYDGVGVPACIRTGRLAARSAVAGLMMDA